jgi:uncharacterized protein
MLPSAPAGRQPLVDVIRGFALFGILVVNMAAFAHPMTLRGIAEPVGQTTLDAGVARLIQILAEGNFYALFATLFGVGFALQLRGEPLGTFAPRYLRRLGALFAFGLLHGVLVWSGDILMLYAVLGVGLLIFGGLSEKALRTWVGVFFVVTVLLVVLGSAAWRALLMLPAAVEALSDPKLALAAQQGIDDGYRIYGTGTHAEIVGHRAVEFVTAFFSVLLLTGGQIFALMLVGVLLAKSSLLSSPEAHAPLLRRILGWGLLVAVPANAVAAHGAQRFLEVSFLSPEAPWAYLAYTAGGLVGGPALAAVYAAGLALLWRGGVARGLLGLLRSAGRMALTNYLLQSVVCTALFYSYGLGLFGRVHAAWGLVLAVVLFAAQLGFSHLWLKAFELGPVEWCWRAVTHLRLPPMRRRTPVPAPAAV